MTTAKYYTRTTMKLVSAMMLIATLETASGFISPVFPRAAHRTNSFKATSVSTIDLSTAAATVDSILSNEESSNDRTAVRAPLKFAGPYPCLGLTFPDQPI
jgi:hypothetical protein